MRIKNGKEIFITNGEGSIWKAIKVKNDCLGINLKIKKTLLISRTRNSLIRNS